MIGDCPQDESCPWYGYDIDDTRHSVLECGHPSSACTGCRRPTYHENQLIPPSEEVGGALSAIQGLRYIGALVALFIIVVTVTLMLA